MEFLTILKSMKLNLKKCWNRKNVGINFKMLEW
jgi:hypothetical protein